MTIILAKQMRDRAVAKAKADELARKQNASAAKWYQWADRGVIVPEDIFRIDPGESDQTDDTEPRGVLAAEKVVGVHVVPAIGMRVILAKNREKPQETPVEFDYRLRNVGTIVWVDDNIPGNDGVSKSKDITAVVWDSSGVREVRIHYVCVCVCLC